DALLMANSAAEERAAELLRDPKDDLGNDPLASVEGETHGTDADAGEYLQESEETIEQPEAEEVTENLPEEIEAEDAVIESLPETEEAEEAVVEGLPEEE